MDSESLTQDDLQILVDTLDTSDVNERDMTLLSSLLLCYPTRKAQNQ